MAISDQLTLLNNTKTAIRTAINNKGGSVGASDTFASYATAIDNLPSGGDDSTLRDLIERDITSITIPSGATKIGNFAFYNAETLTSVTTPNTVTTIGDSAFGYCFNLVSFNIPNSVTSIGSNAFYFCRSLTSLTIPDSVTSIGGSAFTNCSGLLTLKIGSGINRINENTFANCTSLTSIMLNGTTPPLMVAGSGFAKTNNCPIYVPAESVDAYKAATGWTNYASRIYPIQQVATVDGNPVYNYDLRMTSTDTITSENMAKMPSGTSVEFADGLINIAAGEINYQEVILPSTFTGFGDSDMIGSSVTTITSNAVTPPSAFKNRLGGSGLTAIYVPAASVDTYKAHAAWSGFASIIQAIPSPTPSVTSITFVQHQDVTNPGNWGDVEGCSETVNVDAFDATSSGTFDSDIKATGLVLVEDNNGNDITSQCTFTSSDYKKTEDDGTYYWSLNTYVGDADAQNQHSATITATYGNLSDTYTIEWTTTSNCSEPEPEESEE